MKTSFITLGPVHLIYYDGALSDSQGTRVVVVVVLLLYVLGKQLWSCRDVPLTYPHYSWAGFDLLSD